MLGDLTTTGEYEEKRFLLSDNGRYAEERIIIFASNALLDTLNTAQVWWMDGTLDVAPKLFQQLYVLRVRSNDIFITVAYFFMERKTQDSYEEVFQTIVDKCNERDIYPDPKIVHLDFESAVIDALKTVLRNDVRIQGCFYHLTQSTYRKVQKLGLQKDYVENEKFNKFCAMLDALAFLPVAAVEAGMDY